MTQFDNQRLLNARRVLQDLRRNTDSPAIGHITGTGNTAVQSQTMTAEYIALSKIAAPPPSVPYAFPVHVACNAGLARLQLGRREPSDLPPADARMHSDVTTARIVIPKDSVAKLAAYGPSAQRTAAYARSCGARESLCIEHACRFDERGRPAPAVGVPNVAAAARDATGMSLRDAAGAPPDEGMSPRARAPPGPTPTPITHRTAFRAHYDALGAVLAEEAAVRAKERAGAGLRASPPHRDGYSKHSVALLSSLFAFRFGLQSLEHSRRGANAGLQREPGAPLTGRPSKLRSLPPGRDSPYPC